MDLQNMMCSRCRKRVAVVYMTRLENGQTINEGLCLRCAHELGIKPVDDIMQKMGISDEDIDSVSDQMMETIKGLNSLGAQDDFDDLAVTGQAEEELRDSEETAEDDRENELFNPGGAMSLPLFKDFAGGESRGRTGTATQERRPSKFKYLDNFCENLTAKARAGRMDAIVGREREIYRVVQILNRRTKNNPCLIGEPGVGKTAIAEGIAQRIADGDVPPRLRGKELYMLDLTGLVAGTQFRGQFESRVKGLISDVKKAGNVILFIDEVHTLVGVGDSEGSMNAANILKPALSRGEIQVIGATTFNEYRKNIEKDAALERRFQAVKVEEPTIDETVQVIHGVKKYYESYHRVKVSDEIAARTVVLSERYINDRFLPDKAIDLLDEACSCASLENGELAEYEELQRRKAAKDQSIAELEKNSEISYQALAELKADSARLQERIEALAPAALGKPVTEEHLARVIELWTGIPASKIQETEMRRVADLENALKKRIIGQDEAIALVAAAVRRSRVRISPRKRPASFIFVGPTGVGKTELVKVLSQELFDNVEPLIRLDMSEFMEKHSVSRIIGSPPGYVGYDEAGQLTEKVRRRPYSIVLFDEIEKAHPDVMNILLQILDEGRITDAQGRTVSFENTIIVMTSNAGSEIRENALGFNKQPMDAARDKAAKSLSQFLRPEFLARIDEIVVFRPLDEKDFGRIAALMLDELKPSLLERGIHFSYTEAVTAKIAAEAFGHKSGARDIRTLLRRDVEDKICLMLATSEQTPSLLLADVEDGRVVLRDEESR